MRERRRRVAVPSLMHWLNVPRRIEGERVRKLPLTLLLFLHLLAAGLIALALGRPQLLGALSGEARQIAVILDTSTSMAARSGASSRFGQAQERARAALRGLGTGDRATLIAAGPRARVVAAGDGGDVAGLLAAVDRLRPGGTGFDLDGALTLAEAAFERDLRREIVLVTDGATPEPPAGTPARALSAALDWQAVGDDAPNRAIVAFASRPWGANVQVYARAANYGPSQISTSVRLYADGQLLGTRPATIAAGGETELTWTLPEGYASLRAAIDGQDALPEDDQAFLNLAQARPVQALLVSAQPDTMARALAAVPGVNLKIVDPAGYTADAGTFDLTVFDGFLPAAWPTGAVLTINPPAGNPLLDVAGQSRRTEGDLAQNGALLAGLSFGGVNFGPVQPVNPPLWADVTLASGATPLILRGRDPGPGLGVGTAHEVAIWTFDLTASNLRTRLAFPLLVARTVRDLTPPPLPASLLAGAPLALRPDPRAAEVRLTAPDGSTTTAAAAPGLTIDTLLQPGIYQLEEWRDGAAMFRGQVAVNSGAAIESDLRARPAPQLAASDGGAGGDRQRDMTDIWPWLALAALAVLMLEWGYIHR
jgi:hypothetical protein